MTGSAPCPPQRQRKFQVSRWASFALPTLRLLDFIATISAYSLDPLSARGPRLEGIAEVLGLTGDLPVSELHDTHRVRRQAVVCKDEFSDPKVGRPSTRRTVKRFLFGCAKRDA